MNSHASPSPPPSQAPRAGITLGLKVLAVVVAATAQAIVFGREWWSVAGFVLAGLLFLIAERRTPAVTDQKLAPAPPPPRGFWTVLAIGAALCMAAGILVYRGAAPRLTHACWLLGVFCFLLGAASAWWRARLRPRPSRTVVFTILLLLVLAGGFFGWHVASMPPEVHGDEGEVGMDAVLLLTEKPFNLFTVGWYWLPRLHVLRQAIGMEVFGVNLLGLRSTSIVLGAVGVVCVFLVGASLWRFEVGLLAALILVSARFFIHLSRTGMHYLDTPVLSIFVVWAAWRAWCALRFDAAIICGLALGLGIQTYYASRLVPVLLALTWVLWLLIDRDRQRSGARLVRFVVIVAVAVATVAPMAGYFAKHPADLWMRTIETSALSPSGVNHLSYGYGTRDLRYILLVQVAHAVTLFNYTSDSSLQYGFRPGGLFEPVCATLFALGFAAVCARPLQHRNLLLLVWIVVPVILGGALTIDTPFYPRIGGVVPFAALVAALALFSIFASMHAALPRKVAHAAVGLLASGVLVAAAANNVQSYFLEYAPAHRHSPCVEIAAWIRANGAGKTTYMVGGKGFFIRHGTIRFLTYGYATEDVLDLKAYLSRGRFNPATSLFIIMPQGTEVIPQLQAAIGPLDVQAHPFLGNPTGFYTAVPVTVRPPVPPRPVPPASP